MLAESNINEITPETAPAPTILIVDDEASIRNTLCGVFSDEGYATLSAETGEEALRVIAEKLPALVLLDIWMPGRDGIEILKVIKQQHPDLPVIMISGHATIATAVNATRIGAFDFIEKPLDLNATISAAKRALSGVNRNALVEEGESESKISVLGNSKRAPAKITPINLRNDTLRGAAVPQCTLSRSTVLYGQGLHSGNKSGLMLEPLPPNAGIHFVGVDSEVPVPAHLDFVDSTGFATTLRLGETQAGTIEHLMSALHAYGVSNLLVKCNGEVPVMDGSALEFCRAIEEAGIENQAGEWYELAPDKVYQVGDQSEFIRIEPADHFEIDYTLSYPEPIGTQQFQFTLDSVESYKREIASARTFGFVRDIGALQKQGLALGGRFDNFVLIGGEGAINGTLRFADEPVRHKILDVIGDLYLLGRRIRGKVTAKMTGHSDNIALLKALKKAMG